MKLRKVTQEETADGSQFPSFRSSTQTVSELTAEIRASLETEFQEVMVRGEISDWTVAASGHRYFTLKDEKAALSSVCWRNRQIGSTIGNGVKVIAVGGITVYPPRGSYQLDCRRVTPLGQGELQLAFEQLKRKLQGEGLFDVERKQLLPPFPETIGVVTSPTGAAIRDILTTLSRRMPTVHVVLYPAKVQGVGSATEIARGIEYLNMRNDIDLIIAGRGGGSIEDLWAFNEEVVARAIADSRIPIISAVGHEIDFTIADFVADIRAATPTAAAEIAVRDRSELFDYLAGVREGLDREIFRRLDLLGNRLTYLVRSRGMNRLQEIIREHQQRTDELSRRGRRAIESLLQRHKDRQHRLEASLRALDPDAVLGRGYAVIEKDGSLISSSKTLKRKDNVTIRWKDGKRSATITN
ncbi:MAG: exodeoxyribonuclease VII large subunit [Chlorobi bacterium]|nr:exodeoxyribonuclease VII large subunit [Chlorobiota bacterium]